MTGQLLLVFLLGLASDIAPGQKQQHVEFTGSDAYTNLRLSAFEVVKEKKLSLDQGTDCVFVAARCRRGLALFAYRKEKSGFELLGRSSVVPGEQLDSLESIKLGDRLGLVFKVLDDGPDEAIFNEIVFLLNPQGIYPVLKTRWEVLHSEFDAGRTPVEVVDLGGLPMGLSFEAGEQAQQWPTAILRTSPKVLELRSRGGRPARVIVGSHTGVFTHARLGYGSAFRGFQDYLYPVKGLDVHVPGVEDGSGIAHLVDGKADTGWFVNNATEIKVSWAEPMPVRAVMVRYCKTSVSQAKRLELKFSDGNKIQMDGSSGHDPDKRLLGFNDFKSAEGLQTLVFFRKPVSSTSMSVLIRSAGVNEKASCLAEITPMTALVDRADKKKGP